MLKGGCTLRPPAPMDYVIPVQLFPKVPINDFIHTANYYQALNRLKTKQKALLESLVGFQNSSVFVNPTLGLLSSRAVKCAPSSLVLIDAPSKPAVFFMTGIVVSSNILSTRPPVPGAKRTLTITPHTIPFRRTTEFWGKTYGSKMKGPFSPEGVTFETAPYLEWRDVNQRPSELDDPLTQYSDDIPVYDGACINLDQYKDGLRSEYLSGWPRVHSRDFQELPSGATVAAGYTVGFYRDEVILSARFVIMIAPPIDRTQLEVDNQIEKLATDGENLGRPENSHSDVPHRKRARLSVD